MNFNLIFVLIFLSLTQTQGVNINQYIKFKLEGHSNGILSLALLNNGNLASGSADKTIRIWDLASKSMKFKLDGQLNWVRSLTVLNDNKELANMKII